MYSYVLFSLRFFEFPTNLFMEPNRLDFSTQFQNMIATIEKYVSKYPKGLVPSMAISFKSMHLMLLVIHMVDINKRS
jgi:hypothetical protein